MTFFLEIMITKVTTSPHIAEESFKKRSCESLFKQWLAGINQFA